VNVSAIQITRNSDNSSPLVSLAAAQGTAIPTATIMLLPPHAGGPSLQYALVITLTNVFVSQVGSDSSQNNVPLEKLSLSFDQIKWDYTVWQDDNTPGPTITTTYDVTENQVGGNFGYYSTFVYSSSYVSQPPFRTKPRSPRLRFS